MVKNVVYLFIEGTRDTSNGDLRKHALSDSRDKVFYMIQEMEAWILSQPNVLDKFYCEALSKHIPKKHAVLIAEPDRELQNITRNSRKGKYHKVRHGAQLLQMLDAERLYANFADFKRLIDELNK